MVGHSKKRQGKQKIPNYIIPCLWSYDIKKIKIQNDKELIITQVLNYGDDNAIKWLYSVYSEEDIKQVVSNPLRGLWFDKVLNFWEKMLNIRIPKKIRCKAIFHSAPQFLKVKR